MRRRVRTPHPRGLAVYCLMWAVAMLGATCLAQDQTPHPVEWSLRLPATVAVTPKAPIRIAVHLVARIVPGWHIYSLTQGGGGPTPTSIDVPEGQPFYLADEVVGPQPLVDYDANFNMTTETHVGIVDYTLPVEAKAGDRIDGAPLRVSVRYMTCNDRMCLPAQTVLLREPVHAPGAPAAESPKANAPAAAPVIAAGSASVPPAAGTTAAPVAAANVRTDSSALPPSSVSAPVRPGMAIPGPAPDAAAVITIPPAKAAEAVPPPAGLQPATPVDSQGQGRPAATGAPSTLPPSSGRLVWLALSMGFLSALTPCVFPLIPITISFFSQRALAGRSHRLADTAMFCSGVAVTFTCIGLLATAVAGASGISRLSASPWTNLVMGAAFVLFALSLFDKLDLRLPTAFTQRIDRFAGQRAAGGLGVLLMGVAFALTSFTCTAPFVGSLLVVAAQGQWQMPALGMLLYSVGFASPFLLLAVVPSVLGRLPRAGGWMQRMKATMALVELGAAVKFLANADMVWQLHWVTRALCLAAWASLALLAALYLLRIFALHEEVSETKEARPVGLGSLLVAAGFLALAFLFAGGAAGRPLPAIDAFLPPETEAAAGSATVAPSGPVWLQDKYPEALAEARARHTAVFVDFTGYTCTNCRWMESNIFPRPAVAAALGRYVTVHLYTDGQSDVDREQQALEQRLVHTIALPYYVLVDPSGKVLAQFPGLTRDEGEFLRFLKPAA